MISFCIVLVSCSLNMLENVNLEFDIQAVFEHHYSQCESSVMKLNDHKLFFDLIFSI